MMTDTAAAANSTKGINFGLDGRFASKKSKKHQTTYESGSRG